MLWSLLAVYLVNFAKWLGNLSYRNLQFLLWMFQVFARNLSFSLPLTALTSVFCFIWYTLRYPDNAVNVGLIWYFENWIIPVLPSTPDTYKIGYLLSQLSDQIPAGLSGIVFEISGGVLGMLAIYLGFRVVKMLPFVS